MQQTENHKQPNQSQDNLIDQGNPQDSQKLSNQSKNDLYNSSLLQTKNQDDSRHKESQVSEKPDSQMDQRIMEGLNKKQKNRYSSFLQSLGVQMKISHQQQNDASHRQQLHDSGLEARQSISDRMTEKSERNSLQEMTQQVDNLNDVLKLDSSKKQKQNLQEVVHEEQTENGLIQLSNRNFNPDLEQVNINPSFRLQNGVMRFVDRLSFDINVDEDLIKISQNQMRINIQFNSTSYQCERTQNMFEQPYVAPKMEIEDEIQPQNERRQYEDFSIGNNQLADHQDYQPELVTYEKIVEDGQMRISNHFPEQPYQVPEISLEFISKIYTPASAETKPLQQIEVRTFQFQNETKQEFHEKLQLINEMQKLSKQIQPNHEEFLLQHNPPYYGSTKNPPMEIEKNQYEQTNSNRVKLQQYPQSKEQGITRLVSNIFSPKQSETSEKAQSQLNDKVKIGSLKLKNNTVSMALGNNEIHKATDSRDTKRKFSDSFRSVGLSSVGNKILSNRKVRSNQHETYHQDHQNLDDSQQPQLFQQVHGIMEIQEPSEALPIFNKTPNNNCFSNRSEKSHQSSSKSSHSSSYRYNRFVDTMQVPEFTSLEIIKDGRQPRVERRSSLNSYHSRSASTCKKSYDDLTDIHMHKIDESVCEQPDEKSVKKSIYLQKNKIFAHQQQQQQQKQQPQYQQQQQEQQPQHQSQQEQQEKQQIKQKQPQKFNQDKSLQVNLQISKPQSKEDSQRRRKAMKLQISHLVSYHYEAEKKDDLEEFSNKSVQVDIKSESSSKSTLELRKLRQENEKRTRDQDQRISNVESSLMEMKRVLDQQERRKNERKKRIQKTQSQVLEAKQDKQTPEQSRYRRVEVNSESNISMTGSTGTLSVQEENQMSKALVRKSKLSQFAPNLNELVDYEQEKEMEEMSKLKFKDFSLISTGKEELLTKSGKSQKRFTRKKQKKHIEQIVICKSEEEETHQNDETISQVKVNLHKNPKESSANTLKSNEKNDQHGDKGRQTKGILKASRIVKEDAVDQNKKNFKSRNKKQLERNNSLKRNKSQNKAIKSTSRSKQQQKNKRLNKRKNSTDIEETTLSDASIQKITHSQQNSIDEQHNTVKVVKFTHSTKGGDTPASQMRKNQKMNPHQQKKENEIGELKRKLRSRSKK